MISLSIGELARQTGLHTSAIRYYEEIGLMPPPERIGGWRIYEPGSIDRLEVIRTARDMGFSLEEIRLLLDGFPTATMPSERWRTLAEQKHAEIEAVIARATALKDLLEAGLQCTCEEIELCLRTKGSACSSTSEGSADCV
jgi:MerR family redox-sensitive transcriptional activator SoxR